MMIWCDQLVSIVNVRVLINFQVVIYVRIITDYVNFHTLKCENDVITQRKFGILVYTKNQLWVPSSFFNQFVTYKQIYIPLCFNSEDYIELYTSILT